MTKNLILLALLSSLPVSCGWLSTESGSDKPCKNPISMTDGDQLSLADLPEGSYSYDSSKIYVSASSNGKNANAFVTEQSLQSSKTDTDVEIVCTNATSANVQLKAMLTNIAYFTKLEDSTRVYSTRTFELTDKGTSVLATFSPTESDVKEALKTFEMSASTFLAVFDSFHFVKISEKAYELRGSAKSGGMVVSVRYNLDTTVVQLTKVKRELEEAKKKQEALDELIKNLEDPENSAPRQENKIEIKPEEEVITNLGNSNVIARDFDTGTVVAINSSSEAQQYASRNGFSSGAAKDGYRISSSTGGVMGFAPNAAKIPQTVNDMLANIKSNMNSNTGDLDLALVIDYSQSMSDDISAVLEGLTSVTHSLQAIIDSGRRVRVGIVTFGEPGREKVELDFTSSMAVVRGELSRLLNEYSRNSHSTDPGEAWFGGINHAQKNLTWNSRNKSMITITDEESYEVARGQTAFIDQTLSNLKSSNVNLKVYNIIVKN